MKKRCQAPKRTEKRAKRSFHVHNQQTLAHNVLYDVIFFLTWKMLCKKSERTDRGRKKKVSSKKNCKDFLSEINLKSKGDEEEEEKLESTRSCFFIPLRLKCCEVTMSSIFGHKTKLKNSLETNFLVFVEREKRWPKIEKIHEGKGITKRFSDRFVVEIERKIPMCWQIDDGKIVLSTPFFFYLLRQVDFNLLFDMFMAFKKAKRRKLLIKTLSMEKFWVSAFPSSVWFLRPLLLQNKIKTREIFCSHINDLRFLFPTPFD